MSDNKKKTNKTKNYIILGIIVLICIGLTLYFCKWYQVLDEEEKQIPVIREVLPEISNNELDHYILENPSTVIYLCTASDNACRKYESKLKKIVEKYELNDDIVYVNLSDVDRGEFVKSFNDKYKYKKGKLTTNYPAMVIFTDGKVTGMLQGTKTKKLSIEKTKSFIEINKIGE